MGNTLYLSTKTANAVLFLQKEEKRLLLKLNPQAPTPTKQRLDSIKREIILFPNTNAMAKASSGDPKEKELSTKMKRQAQVITTISVSLGTFLVVKGDWDQLISY